MKVYHFAVIYAHWFAKWGFHHFLRLHSQSSNSNVVSFRGSTNAQFKIARCESNVADHIDGDILYVAHPSAYLMGSVHDLATCCEGLFPVEGKEFSVIHHTCFPWSFGELTNPFSLFKNVPTFWLAATNDILGFSDFLNVFIFLIFSLMMACLIDCGSSWGLDDLTRIPMKRPYLKWTLGLVSAPCNWNKEWMTHTGTADKRIVQWIVVP